MPPPPPASPSTVVDPAGARRLARARRLAGAHRHLGFHEKTDRCFSKPYIRFLDPVRFIFGFSLVSVFL